MKTLKTIILIALMVAEIACVSKAQTTYPFNDIGDVNFSYSPGLDPNKWITYSPSAGAAGTPPTYYGAAVYDDMKFDINHPNLSLPSNMFESPSPNTLKIYRINDFRNDLAWTSFVNIRRKLYWEGNFYLQATIDLTNANMYTKMYGIYYNSVSQYVLSLQHFDCDSANPSTQTAIQTVYLIYQLCQIETPSTYQWRVFELPTDPPTNMDHIADATPGNCSAAGFGAPRLYDTTVVDKNVTFRFERTGNTITIFKEPGHTAIYTSSVTSQTTQPGHTTFWSWNISPNFGYKESVPSTTITAPDVVYTDNWVTVSDISGGYEISQEPVCCSIPDQPPISEDCCQPGDPNYNKDEVTLDAAGMKASWDFDRKANCINAYFTLTGNTVSTVSHICARKPGDTNVLVSGAGTFDGTNTVYKVEIPDSMNLGPQELEYSAAGDATWCLTPATP